MYVPKPFSVPANETLATLLPEASFATLVTTGADNLPIATHLPVLYDPSKGEYGVLTAHMARANDHWQYFDQGESLVIFNGPHAYISPRFYQSENNVPTWNYVAVHAYGIPRIIEDPYQVEALLRRLSDDNEAGSDNPWSVDEMAPDRLWAMMKAIVGFEIPITGLQAKAKLGQNKSAEDQASIAAASGMLWPPNEGNA